MPTRRKNPEPLLGIFYELAIHKKKMREYYFMKATNAL